MNKNFNHQKTIGVIGANPDAQAFVLAANRLGFTTIQLFSSDEEKELWSGADKKLTGHFDDDTIRQEFLMQSDLLVYYDYSLTSRQIDEARKSAFVPQKDDLLSIARDRVLQHAFKESLSINIAPYSTIVNKENIKEALRSIGYPAVLKTNLIEADEGRAYFIYEENDIEEAGALLKYGTCVLESWITPESEYALTLVKTSSGFIQNYSVVQKSYRKDRLSSLQANVDIDPELQEEMVRVGKLIAKNIDFQGVMTVNFTVSPAQALYTGDIYPFPNLYARFTESHLTMSANELHLRAVSALPIPETVKSEATYLFVPLYAHQIDLVNDLILVRPDWHFTLYPITKSERILDDEVIGHLIIQTEDFKKTTEILRKYNL